MVGSFKQYTIQGLDMNESLISEVQSLKLAINRSMQIFHTVVITSCHIFCSIRNVGSVFAYICTQEICGTYYLMWLNTLYYFTTA